MIDDGFNLVLLNDDTFQTDDFYLVPDLNISNVGIKI